MWTARKGQEITLVVLRLRLSWEAVNSGGGEIYENLQCRVPELGLMCKSSFSVGGIFKHQNHLISRGGFRKQRRADRKFTHRLNLKLQTHKFGMQLHAFHPLSYSMGGAGQRFTVNSKFFQLLRHPLMQKYFSIAIIAKTSDSGKP